MTDQEVDNWFARQSKSVQAGINDLVTYVCALNPEKVRGLAQRRVIRALNNCAEPMQYVGAGAVGGDGMTAASACCIPGCGGSGGSGSIVGGGGSANIGDTFTCCCGSNGQGGHGGAGCRMGAGGAASDVYTRRTALASEIMDDIDAIGCIYPSIGRAFYPEPKQRLALRIAHRVISE